MPRKAPSDTRLVADWQSLMRTFIRPEDEATHNRLLKYMEQILFGLHDFLKRHVGITRRVGLRELADRYTESEIRRTPEKKLADVISDLIEDIAPHAVNVASPYFVGHMTSALPFFMVHLSCIVAALNQNVVKIETSKVVSIVEKQVMAKIHRLIFGRSDTFYRKYVQDAETTLGSLTEDGTLANLTALWVARNGLLGPKKRFSGIENEGMAAAYAAHGVDRCVVLVSRLAHHSLKKAGGILGMGNRNVIAVDVDRHNRLDVKKLRNQISAMQNGEERIGVAAVVGIAGTTETGTVDPLPAIADICEENGIHFHVDAAWGGPTLMSERYGRLLDGIRRADSVTIDGHKQFYMPMSCGMVFFKDPAIMDRVAYHANYINRPGSVDLGIRSLSGSRKANALILDSTLKIMGRGGYALLIDHGIDTARAFAEEIRKRPDFETVTPPELNILTYRICPDNVQKRLAAAGRETSERINSRLNEINTEVQRQQREAGKSFVSRTTLFRDEERANGVVVFRAVIMNPLTTFDILNEILDEQAAIFRETFSNDPELKA